MLIAETVEELCEQYFVSSLCTNDWGMKEFHLFLQCICWKIIGGEWISSHQWMITTEHWSCSLYMNVCAFICEDMCDRSLYFLVLCLFNDPSSTCIGYPAWVKFMDTNHTVLCPLGVKSTGFYPVGILFYWQLSLVACNWFNL